MIRHRILWFFILCIALLILIIGSLLLGNRSIPVNTIIATLLHPSESAESIIIWHYRLPRTILALLVGSGLGVAGGVMQAMTRNPLADPGLLGVHAGSAFAVVCAMSFLGMTEYHQYVVFALIGAAVTTILVHLLAGKAHMNVMRVRLLLSGVAISAFIASFTGIITMFDVNTFDTYRFWVVGSLEGRGIDIVSATWPFIVVGLVLALSQIRALDIMALGSELSQALGQHVLRTQMICFVAIVLLCGGSTAAAGPLGFIGLVVPHIVKLLVGAYWRWILPYCVLVGAIVLLSADILGRMIARPDEIEAGIVLAMVGAPVLLYLVVKLGGRQS